MIFPLRIIEVENGYVIFEDSQAHQYMSQKIWVAGDITRLLDVISSLAIASTKIEKKAEK